MTRELTEARQELEDILEAAVTHSNRFKMVVENLLEMEEAISLALPFYVVHQGKPKSIVEEWYKKLEELVETLQDITRDNIKLGRFMESLEDGIEVDD